MKMNLQNWLASASPKPHKTSSREIARLLAAADRDLADAQVPGLSADRRFATAYGAALLVATVALAASGYRAAEVGHHYWTMQSLSFTLKLDDAALDKLDMFRRKRNLTDYENVGVVSEKEVDEMLALAKVLRTRLVRWLRETHPELAGDL